uniref:Aminomethyltransferase n=1 Tax=Blastobotrys adeninivorans TaxID=409370 RepID=A0A060T8W2_BLAAD
MISKVTRVSRSVPKTPLNARLYSSKPLQKTALYDFHVDKKGKMVEYAGFEMPVLYKDQTHIQSHNWVRSHAGLFDVSHMFQHRFSGPGATKLLESITPSNLKGLQPFTSTLSVLLTPSGGIVDDTIITKHGDEEYYVVTNAGCRDKDLQFFNEAIEQFGEGNVKRETIGGGLVALQGPEAASVLQKLTNYDLSTIKFGQSAFVDLLGGKYHVARGGYTGEDGFEVSITDDAAALQFPYALMDASESVKPIGLAARDSLRLEAGMCLYGHELSEEITPVEAALTWVVAKPRREEANFNGADTILQQIKNKSAKVRIGLVSEGPAPRQDTPVYSANDTSKPIGVVTSGSMSPTLQKNIAMAYVPRELSKKDTELLLEIRGKLRKATVTKMPFVPPKYYK